MLKKEFRYILKPALTTISVLLIMLLLFRFNLDWLISGFRSKSGLMAEMGMSNHFDLFIAALIITFTSGGFGLGIFKSEHEDKAFEYLFSSPLSKARIIALKVIPRLVALIPFFLIYLLSFLPHTKNVVFSTSGGTTLFNPLLFLFWILFIFFVSMFFSIFSQKNWVAVTSLVTLLSVFIFPAAIKSFFMKGGIQAGNYDAIRGVSFIIGLLLVFLITSTAFYVSFKSFDVKEQSFRGDKFVLISLIPQLILIIISIFILIG